MRDCFSDRVFYHIYPLGMAGAPLHNDFSCCAGSFFQTLEGELDRLKDLGINALYIGPLFESTGHGYDTVDYYWVDRRIGNNESFKHFCQLAHEKGFYIVVDAVFNHTGRDFFAFKDLQKNGRNSQYKDWYLNLNFDRCSDLGDCFDYDGWAGCKDLVKLNVDNQDVRNHLFGAITHWVKEFGIDGLRLDAADVLSKDFLDALGAFCKTLESTVGHEFWLMGEVVHGDYNDWAREGRIHSVTNYQIYKALWSSLNDQNLFEAAYNLNREFGAEGLYRYAPLYNFVDNHDVDRVASVLKEKRHLYLIYGLLFTIPGIPSIYYWSEKGIRGKRSGTSDSQLRPAVPPFAALPDFAVPEVDSKSLEDVIRRVAKIRKEQPAIQKGTYRQLCIKNRQFAFERKFYENQVIVAVNSDLVPGKVEINDFEVSGKYRDELSGQIFDAEDLKSLEVSECWLRILVKM